jgi:hypothetical protein
MVLNLVVTFLEQILRPRQILFRSYLDLTAECHAQIFLNVTKLIQVAEVDDLDVR